jgi:Flp pilus assembly protein TadB
MSDEWIEQLKEEEKAKMVQIDEAELTKMPSANGKQTDHQPKRKHHNHHSSKHNATDHHHPWTAGIILIGIGTVLFLVNVLGVTLENWWALFLLIPAAIKLGETIETVRRNGRFNDHARSKLTGSLILGFIGCIFLFGWDWGVVWPVFLIIAGFSALISGLFR